MLYGVHNIRNHQVCMPVDPAAAFADRNVRLAHAPTNPKDFHTLAIEMAESSRRRPTMLLRLRHWRFPLSSPAITGNDKGGTLACLFLHLVQQPRQQPLLHVHPVGWPGRARRCSGRRSPRR